MVILLMFIIYILIHQSIFQLDSSTQFGKVWMPGFCYTLTVSVEEGLLKPVVGVDRSAIYCEPYIVPLSDVATYTKLQSRRVTVFAQLIYRIDSNAVKVLGCMMEEH